MTAQAEPRAEERSELARIALLEVDPELVRYVAAAEVPRARRAVAVPVITIEEGPFDPAAVLSEARNAFAALIVSGLVARELSAGGQPTLRLLGPGDLLHGGDIEAGLLEVHQHYTAATQTTVALLGDRFLHAVRHWPRILTALVERTGHNHDATLVQLAISQQPRVEDRLVALFGALAERWGRMTADGVLIPLSLTHEALGRLIGARRPTVTLALKALAEDGRLERSGSGSWRLLDFEDPARGALVPLAGQAQPRVAPLPDDAEEATGYVQRRLDGDALLERARFLREEHVSLAQRTRSITEASVSARLESIEVVASARAMRERLGR